MYSAWKHSLYLLFVYELLYCQIYDIQSSNVDTTYIFHFLAIFFTEIFKEKDAF